MSPPRRVLFLSSLWPPVVLGGAELYAARLGRELTARGAEIGAVTLGVEGPDVVETVAPRPYALHEFASQPRHRRLAFHAADVWRPDAAAAVRRAVARFRPDLVHSHSITGLSSSALAEPSRLGVPHVHTVHDYWLLCQRSTMVKRSGEPCARRCASCRALSATRRVLARRGFPHVIVAPSKAIAREHAAFAPTRGRVHVMLHPVDPILPAPPRRTGPPRFGYLGQLIPIKGVPTLLAAFERLGARGATLVVAGGGPLGKALEASTNPAVEYRGWIPDEERDQFFADIDCLVVPSEWKEPAPLVIGEAAARGVPVAAAAIGGIPELVPESCRDLLFRPGDVDDLVRSLERFLTDQGRYAFEPPSWTWDDHLAGLSQAYEAAQRAAR